MTWNMASVNEMLHKGREYGYSIPDNVPFNFSEFKKKRDAEILRTNGAYERNWAKEGIELIRGTASFTSPKELEIVLEDGSGTANVTAKHICIATGGYPLIPSNIEGANLGISSDGFFDISVLPKKIAIVGAGYIAVELAGVLNALDVEVHLFIRGETFLRSFDPMIQTTMTKRYEDVGVIIHKNYKGFSKVEDLSTVDANGISSNKNLKLTGVDGETIEVNELLWAIGRAPETKSLALDKAGVKLNEKGYIAVDDFQNTIVEGIYALGDVTGQIELTPGKFDYTVYGRKFANS